jgi:hypothetical protein
MKARLYRGPADGKIYIVPENELYIKYASVPKNLFFGEYSQGPIETTPTIKTEVYQRTHHTHPDGSVFFEWSKPRRKK